MPLHGYIIVFVGPAILIYNLGVLENVTLSVLSREVKGGDLEEIVYIMDPNPL